MKIKDLNNSPLREAISPTTAVFREANGSFPDNEEDSRRYWRKFKRTAKHKTLSSKRP